MKPSDYLKALGEQVDQEVALTCPDCGKKQPLWRFADQPSGKVELFCPHCYASVRLVMTCVPYGCGMSCEKENLGALLETAAGLFPDQGVG